MKMLGQGLNFHQMKLQKSANPFEIHFTNNDLQCNYGIQHEEKNITSFEYALQHCIFQWNVAVPHQIFVSSMLRVIIDTIPLMWLSGCATSFLILALTIPLLHSCQSASIAHFNRPKVYFSYFSCQYKFYRYCWCIGDPPAAGYPVSCSHMSLASPHRNRGRLPSTTACECTTDTRFKYENQDRPPSTAQKVTQTQQWQSPCHDNRQSQQQQQHEGWGGYEHEDEPCKMMAECWSGRRVRWKGADKRMGASKIGKQMAIASPPFMASKEDSRSWWAPQSHGYVTMDNPAAWHCRCCVPTAYPGAHLFLLEKLYLWLLDNYWKFWFCLSG